MQVEKQFNELDNFLSISSHLKVLLDTKELDRNTLYDLIYCKKKLIILKETDIENEDIKNDIDTLVNKIDAMLSLIDASQYEKIIDKESVDIRKLNRAKQGKTKIDELKQWIKRKKTLDEKKLVTHSSVLIAFIIACIASYWYCETHVYDTLAFIVETLLLLSEIAVIATAYILAVDMISIITENGTRNNKNLDLKDRDEASEIMLNSLASQATRIMIWIKTYSVDYEVLHGKTIDFYVDICNNISNIKSRMKSKSVLESIEAHVDAELLYDKYKYIMEVDIW